ncbi:MAG: hypothetical protein VX836_03465 [Pseudomonadota bacterium]|jgi:hypothetical protein|nr:hypothetical protein [Pseudomonadota bacterium]
MLKIGRKAKLFFIAIVLFAFLLVASLFSRVGRIGYEEKEYFTVLVGDWCLEEVNSIAEKSEPGEISVSLYTIDFKNDSIPIEQKIAKIQGDNVRQNQVLEIAAQVHNACFLRQSVRFSGISSIDMALSFIKKDTYSQDASRYFMEVSGSEVTLIPIK